MAKRKHNVNFEQDSLMQLMQETYNDIVDNRNKAVRTYNDYAKEMETKEDIPNIARHRTDSMRMIDKAIERKLDLIKIQKDIIFQQTGEYVQEDLNPQEFMKRIHAEMKNSENEGFE